MKEYFGEAHRCMESLARFYNTAWEFTEVEHIKKLIELYNKQRKSNVDLPQVLFFALQTDNVRLSRFLYEPVVAEIEQRIISSNTTLEVEIAQIELYSLQEAKRLQDKEVGHLL